MEHLFIALWRAPHADVSTLIDDWLPAVVDRKEVEACTCSFAVEDQGVYAERDPVDMTIALGLTVAHDLDDIPERDKLYALAREVNVWRVDPHHQIQWQRTWPDGEYAPGVKMVSFMRRAEQLTHEQFARHWTENHTPLARKHHPGLWNYTQNVVRRAYTPGGGTIDGIAELQFRSRDSLENDFFDSDEGRAIIFEDVKRFMARTAPGAAIMRELPVKTPAS